MRSGFSRTYSVCAATAAPSNPAIRIDDHVHRHGRDEIGQRLLGPECLHEAAVLQRGEDLWRDAAADEHAGAGATPARRPRLPASAP